MANPEVTGSPFQFIEGRLLNEAELQALLSSEDQGIQTAPIRECDSLEEFQKGQNNFYMTFTALSGKFAHEIYRGKLASNASKSYIQIFVHPLMRAYSACNS